MKRSDTDILLTLLDGRLSSDEERILRGRLESSPQLRAQLADLERMRATLRSTVELESEGTLKPLFSERVMAGLAATITPAEEQGGYLLRFFRPVLAVGLALGAALAIYNVQIAGEYADDGSVADKVLGLPTVSTASIYDLSAISTSTTGEEQ